MCMDMYTEYKNALIPPGLLYIGTQRTGHSYSFILYSFNIENLHESL